MRECDCEPLGPSSLRLGGVVRLRGGMDRPLPRRGFSWCTKQAMSASFQVNSHKGLFITILYSDGPFSPFCLCALVAVFFIFLDRGGCVGALSVMAGTCIDSADLELDLVLQTPSHPCYRGSTD